MTKLTYKRTHRLLQKASEDNYNYHTVEIDINSGLFKKVEVDAANTLIRVNTEVFGEEFNVGGKSNPLTIKQIKALEAQFNAVRAQRDWAPVEFRTTKEVSVIDQSVLPEELKHLASEVNNDLSSSSEVQGQETTEALQQ